MSLVEQMWHRLDSLMDELALLPDANKIEDLDERYESNLFEANLKGKARGMAEMIAIFMSPHFTDANEVAREAKRRADARARDDKAYETRGLGSLRLAPPPTSDVLKYKNEPPKKLPISEDDAAKIRKAYGHFPDEMLAKTFKITVAQVKQIAQSPAPANT